MRILRVAIGILLFIGALSAAWALFDEEIVPPLAPLRVEILNGCGEARLAARVGQHLRQLGQDVREERNAARDDFEQTVLIDRRGRPQLTRRLARALGGVPVVLERRAAATVDVSLVVGRDYLEFELLADAP